MKPIPLSDFGRDHWSTLAYVETCCVDDRGILDKRRMRCNPTSHPAFVHSGGWETRYSTRLKGHSIEQAVLRRGHDDWDCVADFETAGLLTNEGTGINPVYALTRLGSSICAALRAHKAGGGSFSTFCP